MYGISGGAEPRALVDGADVALGGTEQALFRIAQARSAVGQRPRRDSRPQLSRRASPARRQHYGNRASLDWAGEETRLHVGRDDRERGKNPGELCGTAEGGCPYAF